MSAFRPKDSWIADMTYLLSAAAYGIPSFTPVEP